MTDNPYSGISLDIVQDKVQHLLNCISEFECFPFDPAVPTLRTLQSAIAATDKLIADLKSASADGEADLFDSAPKNKRLTFVNNKKTSTVGKDKVTTGIS